MSVGCYIRDNEWVIEFADIVLFDKLVVYDLEKQSIGWIEYNCEYSLDSSLCIGYWRVDEKGWFAGSSSIRVRDETSGNVYGVGSHDISGALTLSVLQLQWSFIRIMGLFLAATSGNALLAT